MKNNEVIQQKRQQLKDISQAAKVLVQMGEFSHVNEYIIDFYMKQTEGITEFNTFNQWLNKGYAVKKGEKAFIIWGSPVKGKPQEATDPSDEYKYFPVCYLFSNLQVERRANNGN